ncbi:hypothetical protein HK102_009641 [Quaeritorhiza haematococci]|nr:hypothetical protein HK102_009641 [Quaeritorhiza haematococci]
MFCALSGEAVEEPVVNKKNGHLYERRLIVKYIADEGKDPITGEEATEEDLVPLKLTHKVVKPRPPTANSVPALLSLLQNEWDSVMLESFQLKQQYHQARQELSNALYECDAAKRVIARLIRERDEARTSLANLQMSMGASVEQTVPQSMDVDEAPAEEGISGPIVQKMDETAMALSKVRRKRKPPPTLASTEEIKNYAELAEIPGLHSASNAGIISMDLLCQQVGTKSAEWVLTGGKDGHAMVLDWKDSGRVVADVKAHSKKVNTVMWHSKGEEVPQGSIATGNRGGVFFTGSADKTVKLWKPTLSDDESVSYSAEYTVKTHSSEVTGLTLHATGDYFASVSSDALWCFVDVNTGRVITQVTSPDAESAYTTASFHPDGLILGAGTSDSIIRIWDVKSQQNVKNFEGHKGKITSISFSENGYYLASSADGEGVVRLWDLRKLVNFHTIELEDVSAVHRVGFDYSGQYLGVAAGGEFRVHLNKSWDHLTTLKLHSGDITGVRFGPNAKYVVTSGMDRKVVVSGVKAE